MKVNGLHFPEPQRRILPLLVALGILFSVSGGAALITAYQSIEETKSEKKWRGFHDEHRDAIVNGEYDQDDHWVPAW